MHIHTLTDERGETVDNVDLCSDSCHRDWCREHGVPYEGWDGCHELEFTGFCAACGVALPGTEDADPCQIDNVVVNRFRTDAGVRCEHGAWIQLPGTRKNPQFAGFLLPIAQR